MFTDAVVSFERIQSLFLAQDTMVTHDIHLESENAIVITNACFSWDTPDPDTKTVSDLALESHRPSFEEKFSILTDECGTKEDIMTPFIPKQLESPLTNTNIVNNHKNETMTLEQIEHLLVPHHAYTWLHPDHTKEQP